MTPFELIERHYGTQIAKRSGVPLMNHINEGLIILSEIGATEAAKRAFELHPLFQSDQDLFHNRDLFPGLDPWYVALVMEYRNIANASLSDIVDKYQTFESVGVEHGAWFDRYKLKRPIKLSPLLSVNQMLIADKVQNRKDFELYHKGTHERSAELDLYFKEWLKALDISEEDYQSLVETIS